MPTFPQKAVLPSALRFRKINNFSLPPSYSKSAVCERNSLFRVQAGYPKRQSPSGRHGAYADISQVVDPQNFFLGGFFRFQNKSQLTLLFHGLAGNEVFSVLRD